MATSLEKIQVTDQSGIAHEVTLQHVPYWGLTTAYYEGDIITLCKLHKVLQPRSDSGDLYWERYTELMEEWFNEMRIAITPKCIEYFNRKLIIKNDLQRYKI